MVGINDLQIRATAFCTGYLQIRATTFCIGYRLGKLPLCYLGLPVGSSMSWIRNWNPIIDNIKSKLSKWKTNMISIGGRAALFTSVLGSLGS